MVPIKFSAAWSSRCRIKLDLAEQLGRMVGFRTIAVHAYQRLDLAKVVDIVENHLVDFQRFTQQILGQQKLF